jgi:hypothetical protein
MTVYEDGILRSVRSYANNYERRVAPPNLFGGVVDLDCHREERAVANDVAISTLRTPLMRPRDCHVIRLRHECLRQIPRNDEKGDPFIVPSGLARMTMRV